MFASATIKLTAWYLLILMTFSILFSIVIYQVSMSEIDTRLGRFESRIDQTSFANGDLVELFRTRQLHESEETLFFGLLYANLVVLLVGGAGSYLLARLTLKPIEEAHDTQARFASDASHELRTPLAVMKSEIEVLLRDKNASKAELRELLESNLEEVNRLTELSQTLLQLTKAESDQLDTEWVNVHETLRQAIKGLKIDKSRIDMPTSMTIIPKMNICGNKSSLRELAIILLDNAVRYSEPGSVIKIRYGVDKQLLWYEIENDGEGINEADLPHIFDRFYRGDKSRTTATHATGYGLGLSLARKIVDVHEGHISILSTPGKLTSVRVELPISS